MLQPFVLFIVATSLIISIPNTQAFEFDVLNTVCGLAVSALNTNSCLEDFKSNIEYSSSTSTISGTTHLIGGSALQQCCAVNIFSDCITNQIRSTCGSATGDTAKTIIKSTIQGLNFISDGELDCVDHWYYEPESPLCWPLPGQIAGAVGLVLILLIGCCCCCCKCCYRQSKRQAATTVIHMVHPTPGFGGRFGRNGGGGEVPYEHLNTTNNNV